MRMEYKGQTYTINKCQLDVINPIFNDAIMGRITHEEFVEKSGVLLEKAGCPFGYDSKLNPDATLEDRSRAWYMDGEVGMSSLAIWHHMSGRGVPADGWRHPIDLADLNRCLLLLDLIPEWAPRMSEMAQYSVEWAGLVAAWGELTACFLSEVGLGWSKADGGPDSWKLMRKALGN